MTKPLLFPDGKPVGNAYLRQTIESDGSATILAKAYGSGQVWQQLNHNDRPTASNVRLTYEV